MFRPESGGTFGRVVGSKGRDMALFTYLKKLFRKGRNHSTDAELAQFQAAAQKPRGQMVNIPIPDPTAEDRIKDHWQDIGQKLARQEDWAELANAFRQADQAGHLTPGGTSVADLIAFGARSDLIAAVEHSFADAGFAPDRTIADGAIAGGAIADGITALEEILEEHPENYALALIVAHAFIDIAWALHNHCPDDQDTGSTFHSYMAQASEILYPFRGQDLHSPALLSAYCILARGRGLGEDAIVASYDALIDFNPRDSRQLRAYGTSLLPQWSGSYERLTIEAQRIAARLEPSWGSGAYTWMMMDAIAHDEIACAFVDTRQFIAGLRDILRQKSDPHTVNLLAAFCSLTMSQKTENEASNINRARISACHSWIIRDYLKELHPLIWAHACHGFDNGMRVRSLDKFAELGLERAQEVLDPLYTRTGETESALVFTKHGHARCDA